MRRVCFTLQVGPDRLDEYRRAPRRRLAGDAAALRDAGWHDYSLFLRDDGLLVGYLLTDDLAAAQAAMEATEVNAGGRPRWRRSSSTCRTAATAVTSSTKCSTSTTSLTDEHLGDDDD